MVETAFQYRGFSLQQEYHWKRVDDTLADAITELEGGYLQVGLFLHALMPKVPRPLEVAVRAAIVDPDSALQDNLKREATLAVNWFFDGHRNKLTLDISRVADEAAEPHRHRETRVRLQWDVSF